MMVSRRKLLKIGATATLGSLAGPLVGNAQKNVSPRTYLLIHGSWFGGWVWGPVAEQLRALGHHVTTPTLTGLGERRHLLKDTATLSTHITDITNHIELEGLTDIDLVGWSYGGMVTTALLAQMPERIRSMTYLDAFVPQDGESLVDLFGPEGERLYGANRDDGLPIPPLPLEFLGVADPSLVKELTPKLTPQPWRTYFEKVTASSKNPDIPFIYVICRNGLTSNFEPFYQRFLGQPNTKTFELQTSHLCMVTATEETVRILAN